MRKSLSTIVAALLSHLKLAPGGTLENAVNEALAEAHDIGIERATSMYKEKIDNLESEYVKMESLLRESTVRNDRLEDEKRNLNNEITRMGCTIDSKHTNVLYLQERLKEKDDLIHDLYNGFVFMVQTRIVGASGTPWTTVACYTDGKVANAWPKSQNPQEVVRIVAMKLNPEVLVNE